MALLAGLRNRLGYLKRVRDYGSIETASLIQRNLPNIVAPLHPDNGRVVCDSLGLSLDPQRHGFYLKRLLIVRDLLKQGVGSFVMNEDGDPEFRSGKVRIVPEAYDDLLVIEEVFVRRQYEVHPGEEWFVWDIGMNVGVASLYYAGIMNWEVLAYEPFPKTYDVARRNIQRSGLGDRVHTRNAGVAASSGTLEVAFNEESRATNSLFGNLHEERSGADELVAVRLVGAVEALQEALALASGRPIFAKIDCEGAEYEILEELAKEGMLGCLVGLTVEYHFVLPEHDPKRLIDLFVAEGFTVQHLWNVPGIAGGLFAIRTADQRARAASS